VRGRYQVYTDLGGDKPAFSSPWYVLATLYVVYLAGPFRRCRIFDVKRGINVNEIDFQEDLSYEKE
jgi:hypothetical protein